MSDPSLLNAPVYEQPAPPVYDYSDFPHSAMAADCKPDWGMSGGVTASASSPQYPVPPRQMTQRGARRMMAPRSNVSSSYMHASVCT